jgi:putative flavoprotein involved in K+ transport
VIPPAVEVLVIGAGQAGLGAAHHLSQRTDREVLVVDRAPVGQVWRDRWDSLQLFTPRRFSALPGLPFPGGPTRSPSRLEMADYLEQYADRLPVPVETGVEVTGLEDDSGLVARTSAGDVRAEHVVLATGPFHKPFVPPAAERLAPGVVQLHSYDYGRPSDLPEGPVLVVGGGNSAAQLAVELARTREVTVAAPREPWFLPEDVLGVSMYWWTLLTGVLNADADARVSRYVRRRGDSIVGKELQALVRSRRVALHTSRVVDADGAVVVLQDGTRLPVRNVLWCTGFRPDTGWIDVPGAVDERGEPVHEAGASPVPGLHWMGLPWQTRLNSSIIDGVDRDAKALADRIGPRRRAA